MGVGIAEAMAYAFAAGKFPETPVYLGVDQARPGGDHTAYAFRTPDGAMGWKIVSEKGSEPFRGTGPMIMMAKNSAGVWESP